MTGLVPIVIPIGPGQPMEMDKAELQPMRIHPIRFFKTFGVILVITLQKLDSDLMSQTMYCVW